jgi:ClpP class serine protease
MMPAWLIDEDAGRALAALWRSGQIITAEHQIEHERIHAADGDVRGMTRAGASAEIVIDGVLTERTDWFALIFGLGNTTYGTITRALSAAAADHSIGEVVLRINSPGGTVDGLFETLAAIERFRADSGKKLRVIASRAQSAAYAIAAVAGKIEAATEASAFGSIGVAVDLVFYDGEKHVPVTSTEAPDKRPNLETEEGRSVLVAHLDELHSVFVDAIARGRTAATGSTFTVEQVNTKFGRGRSFLAKESRQNGMIDSWPKPKPSARAKASDDDQISAATGGEEHTMKTLAELRAQHPELYAAAVAEGHKDGLEKGTADERKRCCAHLKLAKSTGAIETAHKYIESGASTLDEDVHAEYLSAGINRREVSARQVETDAAGKVVDGAKVDAESKPEPDAGDVLVAHLKAQKSKVVL